MDSPEQEPSENPLDAARTMERRERDDKIAEELEQTARVADAMAERRDEHPE